ncbi:type II CAAX prenyl endopeptidase Rce1 family protein [Candidatus Enterococcus clewellii]|uniref:CAAX prenyl protease 2/Lysostaphin resistance protein A-like domain-containing protein n=1 Tax=Candidatus Enterococcus clewellii TaxID=1834193 RepID=A0A242K935_9ENTE|nr:CPBP family glutamic-type intramembrane protease [Enterococcus sp. 9E7_DIV0242]OTP17685.1 hypothetical protein A5888_001823 [Enterococcus sp. 9E7_DIV0242]
MMELTENNRKKTTIKNGIIATGIMIVAIAGLITGFGGPISACWLALGGFTSLYLLGGFDLYKGKFRIRHILSGFLMLIGVLIASGIFGFLLKDNGSANPAASLFTKSNFFLMWITMIVPSLIGEEAFTAAFIKIGQTFSNKLWIGVVLSTVLFTAMHIPEYHGSIVSLFGVLGARLVFTYIAFKKDSSFKTATVLHILYDTLLFGTAVFFNGQ